MDAVRFALLHALLAGRQPAALRQQRLQSWRRLQQLAAIVGRQSILGVVVLEHGRMRVVVRQSRRRRRRPGDEDESDGERSSADGGQQGDGKRTARHDVYEC